MEKEYDKKDNKKKKDKKNAGQKEAPGQTGLYTKPLKGWSSRTNTIVGTAFLIFVIACFIIRGFVGNKGGDSGSTEVSTEVTTTEEMSSEETSSEEISTEEMNSESDVTGGSDNAAEQSDN